MSMPDMNDFTGFLKKALPWIGAAATGNVPALIAMAAKTVGDTLGVEVSAEPAAISDAVANATPEQIIALKTAEQTFQRRCRMGFAQSRNGADWPRCDTSVHRRHCGAARSTAATVASTARDRGAVTFAIGWDLVWGSYFFCRAASPSRSRYRCAVFGFLGTNWLRRAKHEGRRLLLRLSRDNDKTQAMASAFQHLGTVPPNQFADLTLRIRNNIRTQSISALAMAARPNVESQAQYVIDRGSVDRVKRLSQRHHEICASQQYLRQSTWLPRPCDLQPSKLGRVLTRRSRCAHCPETEP